MNSTKKINYICKWIKKYVDTMQKPAETLVVGISGGIDSALSSTLSSRTGIKTIAISMPISTNQNPSNLGAVHGKWLTKKFINTTYINIDLTETYKMFHSKLGDMEQLSELGFANSKARLRMMTLYQVASSQNGIVVGTGNKVEDFGVGFYTKYGDGGVDISPIADLMKSEVKELSKALEIDSKEPSVLESLGSLYLAQENYDLALKFLNDALDISTDDKKRVDLYFNRGLVYLKLKNFEEAEYNFEEAYFLAPEDLEALLGLAQALEEAERWRKARNYYMELIDQNPNEARYYYGVYRTYFGEGRLEDAQEYLNKATALKK